MQFKTTKGNEVRKKYFTENGEKALFTRLNTLIKLYKQGISYPYRAQMLGFVALSIQDKQSHIGMMNELRQILCLNNITIEIEDHGRKEKLVIG